MASLLQHLYKKRLPQHASNTAAMPTCSAAAECAAKRQPVQQQLHTCSTLFFSWTQISSQLPAPATGLGCLVVGIVVPERRAVHAVLLCARVGGRVLVPVWPAAGPLRAAGCLVHLALAARRSTRAAAGAVWQAGLEASQCVVLIDAAWSLHCIAASSRRQGKPLQTQVCQLLLLHAGFLRLLLSDSWLPRWHPITTSTSPVHIFFSVHVSIFSAAAATQPPHLLQPQP